MQMRQNLFPYFLALAGAGALITSSYVTASNWTHGLLVSFLCGCLFTAMVGFGVTKLKAAELKFERQLRELEMEAHRHNVSALEIDTHIELSHKLKHVDRIIQAESRSEKLSFILEQLGFSHSHKLLRDIRERRKH